MLMLAFVALLLFLHLKMIFVLTNLYVLFRFRQRLAEEVFMAAATTKKDTRQT